MIQRITTNKGGLLRLAIFIIIILIIIAYFGLDLRGIVNSPTFQNNWKFVSGIIVDVWNMYLKGIVMYIWTNLLLPIVNSHSTASSTPM